nr:MAG TPA: hypothetical protein [Caudoviricetes sp.]
MPPRSLSDTCSPKQLAAHVGGGVTEPFWITRAALAL